MKDKTLADAWDEGFEEGLERGIERHDCGPRLNPYRSTKQPVPQDAEHYSADLSMWLICPAGKWSHRVRATGPGYVLLDYGSGVTAGGPDTLTYFLITFVDGEFDECKKLDNPVIGYWGDL